MTLRDNTLKALAQGRLSLARYPEFPPLRECSLYIQARYPERTVRALKTLWISEGDPERSYGSAKASRKQTFRARGEPPPEHRGAEGTNKHSLLAIGSTAPLGMP